MQSLPNTSAAEILFLGQYPRAVGGLQHQHVEAHRGFR